MAVVNSTLSGNITDGPIAIGGGLFSDGSTVLIEGSAVTGNSATRSGGGISVDGVGSSGEGFTVRNSIIARNTGNYTAPDLVILRVETNDLAVSFSLIGDSAGTSLIEAQTPDASGNLIGSSAGGGIIDPLFGPLADNGGPTLTHALLPGSPALNAGNPTAAAGQGSVPEFDQRGVGFGRVNGGRIDMGSFELQEEPLSCDFDGDLDCDIDEVDNLFA